MAINEELEMEMYECIDSNKLQRMQLMFLKVEWVIDAVESRISK